MKAFFEEYGMVLIVTIVAVGMITFSMGFRDTLGEMISDNWTRMLQAGEVE
ncbi:MAG: hypothetical protein ACRDBX_04945 [Erysipelotrichaceae bacterium]